MISSTNCNNHSIGGADDMVGREFPLRLLLHSASAQGRHVWRFFPNENRLSETLT